MTQNLPACLYLDWIVKSYIRKMNCDQFLFNVAGLLVAYAYGMFVLNIYRFNGLSRFIIMERPKPLSLITSV